jgi:hypothetical protein
VFNKKIKSRRGIFCWYRRCETLVTQSNCCFKTRIPQASAVRVCQYIYNKKVMAFNFGTLIINTSNATLENMPPIDIDKRQTDKFVLYNKNLNRLDRLAGDIYEDETLWKVILWANPEYDCEFDIPDNTPVRVPWPKIDVLDEISKKIINRKNLG